jgi:hypothetical protein
MFLISKTLSETRENLQLRQSDSTKVKKGKAIPLTGRKGPPGCETSRFPHFLDNRPTDGGKVVSLMRRPPFTPQEDAWYSFLLEAESTPGPQCGWKD